MTPVALLALQIASSFVVLGLFATSVVAPHLEGLPRERALVPLLWTHTLRYVPLALFAPGQVGREVSPVAVRMIAWGDFGASVLAVTALVALRLRSHAGVPLVWTFSIASTIDIALALAVGLASGVHKRALGVGWYVLMLYVPLICVTQWMIFVRLVSRSPELAS